MIFRPTPQRLVQLLCLLLFLLLIGLAAFPLVSPLPVDAFLRMDPVVALAAWAGSRSLLPSLWPAAALLLFTLVLGRFFCGYVCPLGTVIDASDALVRRTRPRASGPVPGVSPSWRRFGVLLLLFLAGAALLGVSFVFLAEPMVLATRFFALLVHPVASLLARSGLGLLRPLADALDMTSLAYLQIDVPRYAFQWFTLAVMVAVLAGGRIAPRFWCRAVCPAGAAFGLCSSRPLIRRRVSEDCIQCGACQRACPMGAIPGDPFRTDFAACITCHACERICPTRAVSFGTGAPAWPPVRPDRREALLAGLAGAGAAMVTLTGLGAREDTPAPGRIHPPELIRPPGALPEREFLARCVRCGACMKACPTNTLQPAGLSAGIEGFFSPRVTPRRGPCEPLCTVCGEVCPTGAIRVLPAGEKIWAKIGTAQILRHKCLAWEFDRRCLVCDEVCPYDAISLRSVPGVSVAVPFVEESRCSGCGFCEHQCPVQARAAIVVEPMEALRLREGSFREKGRAAGLRLSIDRAGEKGGAGPPSAGGGLPPGFTE